MSELSSYLLYSPQHSWGLAFLFRPIDYWRPQITDIIHKYLDCGDLNYGFARVKCNKCNNEYLFPFSCKRRHFWPSCHQKRVIELGLYLDNDLIKKFLNILICGCLQITAHLKTTLQLITVTGLIFLIMILVHR